MDSLNALDTRSSLVGNRYRLLEPLGEGGMGAVFRAYDRLTGQSVALKRILMAGHKKNDTPAQDTSPHIAMLALAEEFKMLASLRHPNVISVLDYGFDAQQPYFTMLLLENAQTIADYGHGQPLRVQIDLLVQTLQALAYVHRLGVLHRDLKPDNVQVVNGQVKVLDFGLAVTRHTNRLVEGESSGGTLPYMAPEVLQGYAASEAADLYAVGILAYELFTGVHPYRADSISKMVINILQGEPDLSLIHFNSADLPDSESVTESLRAVIQRVLNKDPQARYADAQEVIAGLCAALGQPVPEESGAIRESFLQASRLVGRAEELERLDQGLRQISGPSRQGSAWLIAGESGIGKSRLLDAIRVRGLVSGATVLRGQAANGGTAYSLWREPLRHLLLAAEVSDLEARILKLVVQDIGALLGRKVADAPEIDDAARGQRLLLTIEDLFRRQQAPILLMLEDLHWAENDLDLLKRLTTLVSDHPLMIVGSYRDDEKPALAEKLPEMQVLKLQRLKSGEIADLSQAILGNNGRSPDVINLLERETEGNTFFLIEVIRVLAQSAGRLQNISESTLPLRVFAGGVQTVVRERLSRLPESDRPLLQVAAVAGRMLDLRLIRALAASNGTDVEDWLTRGANAAVLDVDDGQWRFAHDKLREALLADLPDVLRPDLHQRIAQAIETIYGESEQHSVALLDHWTQAGNRVKEAHYAQLAGDQAMQISAFGQALILYRRALALLSADAVQRLPLLLSIGEVNLQLGNLADARQDFETVLALESSLDVQAEALYQLSQIAAVTGDLDRTQHLLSESLVLARTATNTLILSKVLYGLGDAAWRQGKLEQARQLVAESLEIARRAESPTRMLYALNRLGAIHLDLEERTLARQYYAEGKALALQTGNRERIAAITMNMGLVDYFEEHYLEARASYLEALALSQEIGSQHLTAVNLLNIGDVSLRLQDTLLARKYLYDALALTDSLGAVALSLVILTNIGALYAQLGDYAGALELFGLARFHPAADANARQEQARFLKEIEQNLTPDEITSGLEQGRTLDFEQTIERLLGN